MSPNSLNPVPLSRFSWQTNPYTRSFFCSLLILRSRPFGGLFDKGPKLGCVTALKPPQNALLSVTSEEDDDDKDLSCRSRISSATPLFPDRIKPHPSIGPTPKFPSPSGNYLPPLCGYYYHSARRRGKRDCGRGRRWERQTQPQNCPRAPQTLKRQSQRSIPDFLCEEP